MCGSKDQPRSAIVRPVQPKTYFYPKDPDFKRRFGPRGVFRSSADGKIEDTGPMTRKRMETANEEFLTGAVDFIERTVAAEKPFFVWLNAARMHIHTRLKPESVGVSGMGLYPDGMVEHGGHVGQLPDRLDRLKVADNTIVVHSTNNGAEKATWPDGGVTPFHGEKSTTWDGGMRAPALVLWPATIAPGSKFHDIMSHEDWMPTLLAAARENDLVQKLKNGHEANVKRFKVHPDGYNFMPYFNGEAKGPRETIFYFDQQGNLDAIRWKDWKVSYANPLGDLWFLWSQYDVTRFSGDALPGAEWLHNIKFQPVMSIPILDFFWNFIVRPVFQKKSARRRLR